MMLVELRQRQGLSQRALAAKAKMSQTYLCNVEIGKADPSLTTLKRLARALGVNVSELVKEPQSRERK
jgi:transcriptional regulator with XRE-family HTH domain